MDLVNKPAITRAIVTAVLGLIVAGGATWLTPDLQETVTVLLVGLVPLVAGVLTHKKTFSVPEVEALVEEALHAVPPLEAPETDEVSPAEDIPVR